MEHLREQANVSFLLRKIRKPLTFVRISNPTTVTMEKAMSTNLRFLQFYCKYMSFPMDIDPKTGSVRSSNSGLRVGCFCVLLSLFAFKSVAGIATFAHSIFQKSIDFNSFYPMFSIVIIVEYTLAFLWGYFKLIQNRVSFAETLQMVVASQEAVTKRRMAHFFLWVYPASVIFYTQLGNVFMSLDLNWIVQTRYQFHLLFEVAGAETSGWAYISASVLAVVVDTVAFTGVGGMAQLLVYSHLSFMEVWTDKMAILVGNWKAAKSEGFAALWAETRQQTVFLRLFNQSHKMSVFATKVGGMTLSCLSISSLLIFEFENPLITYAIAYNGIFAAVGYIMLYQKAYYVKELLEDTKQLIAEIASKQNSSGLVKRARGLASEGIWVGSFVTFERESMLNFSDFIVNQVIEIVLTVKG